MTSLIAGPAAARSAGTGRGPGAGGGGGGGLAAWYAEYGLNSRATCRRAQLELARADRRILSVENDLGLPEVPFDRELPGQYLQVGIAEANLLSVAAGLAMWGNLPFVNTFAVFATMRACEQLRLDIAYAGANVKVMGYYTGLSGGHAGPTHSCIEDIAITRAIPGLTVLSPADAYETYLATKAAASHPGPVYLRASRAATPAVYRDEYDFRIGRAVRLRDGADVTIVATGCLMVSEALRAADLLAADGVECGVLNVHTLKPLDTDAIVAAARGSRLLVTCEDHNVIGGLGSAVAGVVSGQAPVPVLRYGVPDQYCGQTAEYEDMPARYGFGAGDMYEGVRAWLASH
ncbi:MAG: transketolase [Mycobacteriales bacterium]